jgi:acetolactate synthase-1/2/3 large subunit
MFAALYYGYTEPRTFISSCGLGTMGYGLPAAIGAGLARPDKQVWLITGEGSFQMHMAELGTAREQGLLLKILLFNNNCLGMVRQLQHDYYQERYIAIKFTGNPDFVRLAECYGAAAMRISKPAEVVPVLAEAIQNERLTLIECLVSEEEMVNTMVPSGEVIR